MRVYLQSVLWICHISNFSMLATTQHVLHLCECAADVTSSLLSSIWCRSSGKTHTWKWQLIAVLCNTFHRQERFNVATRDDRNETFNFSCCCCFSLFLCATVWPNLFFWACRGRAAHPANVTEEVWSLHSNLASPTLCPHSCSAPEFTGGVGVARCHRLWVR